MKKGIIYIHIFPNGKGYVGQTIRTLPKRMGKGFSHYKPQPAIWNAVQKYGHKNIKTEVLYRDIPENELDRYERLCISRFGTHVSVNGYNETMGGEGFDSVRAKEVAQKMLADGTHPWSGPELNNKKVREGTHPWQDPEKARQREFQRVKDGTHPFLGGEVQRRRVRDGTHNLLGGKIQRAYHRKAVAEGTHHWLGPETNNKRVREGTHPWLDGERSSRTQLERVANGTHHFVGDTGRKIQRKSVYRRRINTKNKRRKLYRLYASIMFTKSLCEIYRARKWDREGFFDKDIPVMDKGDQLNLFE